MDGQAWDVFRLLGGSGTSEVLGFRPNGGFPKLGVPFRGSREKGL